MQMACGMENIQLLISAYLASRKQTAHTTKPVKSHFTIPLNTSPQPRHPTRLRTLTVTAARAGSRASLCPAPAAPAAVGAACTLLSST